MFLNECVLAFGARELFIVQEYFVQPKLPPRHFQMLLVGRMGFGGGDDTNHPLKRTDIDYYKKCVFKWHNHLFF